MEEGRWSTTSRLQDLYSVYGTQQVVFNPLASVLVFFKAGVGGFLFSTKKAALVCLSFGQQANAAWGGVADQACSIAGRRFSISLILVDPQSGHRNPFGVGSKSASGYRAQQFGF